MMMYDLDEIKYLFLGIRYLSGMNKNNFYKATGIFTVTLTALEEGKQQPTLKILEKYAKFLNCKVYHLVQVLEEQNHLTEFIQIGKEFSNNKALQQRLKAVNLFNELTTIKQQKFLENEIKNLPETTPNN